MNAEEICKNIIIVYNPNAGRGKAKVWADKILAQFAKRGITAELACSDSIEAAGKLFEGIKNGRPASLCVIIGGDGTLGPCINAMLQAGVSVPVFAFGKGTANDFAGFFKTNVSAKKAVQIIMEGHVAEVDTLKIKNNADKEGWTAAINVAAGGAFTNGVTTYKKKNKRRFGRFAYLGKAAGILFRSGQNQKVKFTVDGQAFEDSVWLFYILNTRNVGSLKKTATFADASDGLLDLVAIKKCGFWGKVSIGCALLFNRVCKNKHIIYTQGKHFTVVPVGEVLHNFTKTDIDGNCGGDYPLEVEVGTKIKLIVKK